MNRIAMVVALGFVVVAVTWLAGPTAAQPQNRRGKDAPAPSAEPDPQPRRDVGRDKVVVTVEHIPTFMQAGRNYVFVPVGGEEFSGRVISLDSTGWVQVQHRAGGDVGPLAEWYNLVNMVSIKAMN